MYYTAHKYILYLLTIIIYNNIVIIINIIAAEMQIILFLELWF